MSLGEHLDELRSRLIKGLVAVAVVFFAGWTVRDQIYTTVTRPMRQAIGWLNEDLAERYEARLAADPSLDRSEYFDPQTGALVDPIHEKAQVTQAPEAFVVHLKSTLYVALFLGGPILLWQMWQFIAAGLYPKERRVVLSYLPSSVLLFFVGVLFGYFTLVPYGLFFLNSTVTLEAFRVEFRASDYFTFLSSMCLGLGVVFQLPILMNALTRVGLVQVESLAKFRGYFALIAFVVGAILTPPDPFTQSMMAIPMILLYELGILTSRWTVRRSRARLATPAGSAP
jgi:sec-independent protein translocase protein TatC